MNVVQCCFTGSAPSYLSELLHLYSPSHSLHSSSDTCMLKIQRFNHKTHGFRTFSHFGPHIWNNLPQDIRHSATLSSFKSQLEDISLLRIFQLSHIALHSYQSVQCVCVCVCISSIVFKNPCRYLLLLDNIFHLDVHYVCMLVQCFETQGRPFTIFHYYYYLCPQRP